MINLMPDYLRQEVGYARRNYVLLKWLMAIGVAIIAVGLMTMFGQYYINRNTKSLQATAEITQTRINSQNLQETQADIQGLSNNFITITQLLKRQLLFSKMFVKIGGIIPQGAILRGITLSTTTSAAIDLNVIAANREAATLAFVNISDPTNGLFDKADLLSVSCSTVTAETEALSARYPCSAMIKVVIKTDSSFYFLNSLSSTGSSQ
jgi:HAMP domain-containing protein